MSQLTRRAAIGVLSLAGAYGAYRYLLNARMLERAEALYADPLPRPETGMTVFHLGHSLVGRDMPAMLAQLAGAGHGYHSQLGWGTSLKEHWEPELEIQGFAQENDHAAYRPARQAIASGSYDSVILTEMVEISDAVRYHESAEYLARWAGLAWDANPQARIYLYETWHHTDDDKGWLYRIDSDLRAYWQDKVKYPALGKSSAPIHLIPAGQVKAAFVRAAEDHGGLGDVAGVDDLFARHPDGRPDTIHFNDLGAYLVALTHFAVLYHRSPLGAPFALLRADGTAAQAPTPQTAALMQEIVWQVVLRHPETGVAA
jgi:hypothetical protein